MLTCALPCCNAGRAPLVLVFSADFADGRRFPQPPGLTQSRKAAKALTPNLAIRVESIAFHTNGEVCWRLEICVTLR